ncbi:uncharacterized protein LOC111409401 [Olea europaea var. sylvestris]|uniref:uncharacterized protein LOC111409401 n=1 Tax=Olea europaea var. sylvestris TaxID=158386 RepID=UPI000C1D3CA9|nr:uncharacterized protein LOC111409401 [Olea europaea var. sylvestris]
MGWQCPVLVKKHNGKWRVCINFTNLNRACPKDSFPLPRIDQLADSTAGHELLSFMDAYSGYNQIPMHPTDEEHTSFITDQGLYCYRMMHFGLKNAGATYQRLVNKMFTDLIGKTMEVYVDNMLVKSLEAENHVAHLNNTFQILRRYRMRLNPLKCAFGAAIKGQALADFVAEFANLPEVDEIMESVEPPTWSLLVDGSAGEVGSGTGVVLISPEGHKFTSAVSSKDSELLTVVPIEHILLPSTEAPNVMWVGGTPTWMQPIIAYLKDQALPTKSTREKLDVSKRGWVDELPQVLWAIRTTTRTLTGEIPFLMAFGTEAMSPVEVRLPSPRRL